MISIPQIRKYLIGLGLPTKASAKPGLAAHQIACVRITLGDYIPKYALLFAEGGATPQKSISTDLEALVRENTTFNQGDILILKQGSRITGAVIKVYQDDTHFEFQLRAVDAIPEYSEGMSTSNSENQLLQRQLAESAVRIKQLAEINDHLKKQMLKSPEQKITSQVATKQDISNHKTNRNNAKTTIKNDEKGS